MSADLSSTHGRTAESGHLIVNQGANCVSLREALIEENRLINLLSSRSSLLITEAGSSSSIFFVNRRETSWSPSLMKIRSMRGATGRILSLIQMRREGFGCEGSILFTFFDIFNPMQQIVWALIRTHQLGTAQLSRIFKIARAATFI